MRAVIPSSAIAAAMPSRRAGSASSAGTVRIAAPAALAVALAAKTNGISTRASDQAGIALWVTRAAV
jgi:hypothetical protein